MKKREYKNHKFPSGNAIPNMEFHNPDEKTRTFIHQSYGLEIKIDINLEQLAEDPKFNGRIYLAGIESWVNNELALKPYLL